MKHIFFKFKSKSIVTAAFLTAVFFITNVTKSSAKNSGPFIEIISADSISKVTYVGTIDNALLFNVALKNEHASSFILTIKNESGEVLFTKGYTDTSFDKNFKIIKGETASHYYFSIRSENKNLEQTFIVSTATRQIDDVVVTKL